MKIIILVLWCLFAFFIYVRIIESRSVFYPYKNIQAVPSDMGLVFEDVYFPVENNIQLNGWFVGAKKEAITILFLHGNAGNIGGRLEKISLFNKMGFNVFIIDYRGYGNSQGKPTELGINADARAAFDYLVTRDDIDRTKIIVYGVSLGGVPAVDLATQRDVAGLIVDSSFTNAADMAKKILPFVPGFMLKTKMRSDEKIKEITVPKMIMHSIDDETVPFKLGQNLYSVASEPKVFLQMEGGHNDGLIYNADRFESGIMDFLKSFDLF